MEQSTIRTIKIKHIISLYDMPHVGNQHRKEQNTYLGEDATRHTGEDGHRGGTHTEAGEGGHIVDGVLVEGHQQRGQGAQTHRHHGEAHDTAGGEGHGESVVQALLGRDGGTSIGVGGDHHADEAATRGGEGTSQVAVLKRKRTKYGEEKGFRM